MDSGKEPALSPVPAHILQSDTEDLDKAHLPVVLSDMDKELVPADIYDEELDKAPFGMELVLAGFWGLGKELVPAHSSMVGLGKAPVFADSLG